MLQIAFLSMSCAGAKKAVTPSDVHVRKQIYLVLSYVSAVSVKICKDVMEEDDIIDYGLDEDVDSTLHDEF